MTVILGSDAKSGDELVLCGDGLWRPVTEAQGHPDQPAPLEALGQSVARLEGLADKILLAVTVLAEAPAPIPTGTAPKARRSSDKPTAAKKPRRK